MCLALGKPEETAIGLRKQYFWILAGRTTGALAQAASLGLVARWSGPEAFGLFSSVYGIAIVAQTVADFGLTNFIVRQRAADPADARIGAALRLGRNISVITAVVGTATLLALAARHPDLLPLTLMALWMSAEKQVEAWLGVSLADGQTWNNALSLVFRRIGALLVLVATVSLGVDPVVGYLLGLTVFSLIAWVVAYLTTKSVTDDRNVSVRELLAAARHYWLNSLGVQSRNFDVSVVAAVASPVAAGYYAAASRLTTPLRIVPTSFATVLLPAAAKTDRENSRHLVRAIGVLTLFTTVLYIGLALLLPVIVPALLGHTFTPAVPVIQIVCVGMIFAAVTSQLNSLMQGWGHLKAVATISTATTALCLVGVAALSIPFGAMGAGAALALSYVVQLGIQWVYLARAGRQRR